MNNGHKYQIIAEDIRNAIIRGELNIGQKLPTEMEVVDKYSTSRPTVTKAMELLVSQGFIVREQGRGSFVADRDKEMKIRSLNIVSLILPFGTKEGEGIYHQTEIMLIRGVEAALKAAGFYLMLHYVDSEDADEEIRIIKKCRYELSEGVIVYPTSLNDMFIDLFDMALDDYPMVFLTQMSDSSFLFVGSDNVKVGHMATTHLIERRYEKIYFISPYKISSNYTLRDRYIGYNNALRDKGLRSDRTSIWENVEEWDYEELRDKVAESVVGNKRVGFFATQEGMSLKLMDILDELKVSIPEKAGIVSVDSRDLFINTIRQISSVEQDIYAIGKTAANVIIDRIKGKQPNSTAIGLNVSFFQGETT